MHVTHFGTRALAVQTARTQCGQTALVGQLGQAVDLIHELRQLVMLEEFIDALLEITRADELADHRLAGFHLACQLAHAVARQSRNMAQADAADILHQLADCTDTAA